MADVVKISRALGDPIRYKIMTMLARSGEGCCPVPAGGDRPGMTGLCNCELVAELGLIQSRVSYHMKELADAGLVTETPRGKWKVYFLNEDTLAEYLSQVKEDFSIK